MSKRPRRNQAAAQHAQVVSTPAAGERTADQHGGDRRQKESPSSVARLIKEPGNGLGSLDGYQDPPAFHQATPTFGIYPRTIARGLRYPS